MYSLYDIKENIVSFVNESEKELVNDFSCIESIYEKNQLKVLKAFRDLKISESHFQESTGYGYSDIGRDTIEEVYAHIFHTEDALVRQQIVSGTHAISLVLFALTRPGDKILSITGLPYDTILSTIGTNNEKSSLKEYNIDFDYVNLKNNEFDKDSIKSKLSANTKLIMIQRSRGYSDRKALSIRQIEEIVKFIKSIKPDAVIMVDNCYGEFVDEKEPTDVGADIMCGSLIKNPGGSLVKAGAYIAGRKDLIELCSYRLTAPGIGKEVGINFNQNRTILHGLYLAPQIVANALKIVKLFAKTYNKFNIDTIPNQNEELNDIVLSIKLGDADKLKRFCEAIQSTSPIDSFVKPVENDMPGYDSKVIMAAGNFISGASLELSCDAPLRPPYMVYMQGGITYYQGKLALMKTIQNLGLI